MLGLPLDASAACRGLRPSPLSPRRGPPRRTANLFAATYYQIPLLRARGVAPIPRIGEMQIGRLGGDPLAAVVPCHVGLVARGQRPLRIQADVE